MHSMIWQLTKKKTEWIDEDYDDLDGFVGRVADYTRTFSSGVRKEMLEWFAENPISGITVNPVNEILTVDSCENYFEPKFKRWRELMGELYTWNLADFCGPCAYNDYLMSAFEWEYEDRFGMYVCDCGEWGGLMTFDDWMRCEKVNDGDKFYIGSIIDYHF